jgi:magnesium-transporting ATPase (P-type)
MRRPPRPPREPLLSGLLVWRVVFVSILFALAAFAIFAWSEWRGLPLDAARTAVVNTLVVLEIVYLFSVRYQHRTSFTWRGAMGTPAVLVGVGAVVLLQLAFTYAPPLQWIFGTQPLDPIHDGLPILAAGLALFLCVEAEKVLRAKLPGRQRRLAS